MSDNRSWLRCAQLEPAEQRRRKYQMKDDDFDLARAGRLIDENEFEIAVDLPTLAPRYRRDRRGWWTPSNSEEHHLDLPPITSAADRARWMISEMARAGLAGVEGATADDQLFETRDGLRSLNELLRGCGGDPVSEAVSLLQPSMITNDVVQKSP